MIISGVISIFLVGCLGGIFSELLRWYQLRESAAFPAYLRSLFYWTMTAAMIVAGGVVSVFYGTEPKSAMLVLNIGLSAPLIIKQLSELRPETRGVRGPSPSLTNFLAGR